MSTKKKAAAPKAAADEGHEGVVAGEDALVSRDETHDSIDPATGMLSDEAVARRAELAEAATAVGAANVTTAGNEPSKD